MVLTQKQKIGQQILAHHNTIRAGKITLMYTPRPDSRLREKPSIIVSISKKTAPKAVQRNYIKRVLRAFLRQTITKERLQTYDWMWICKESAITTEFLNELKEKLNIIA